MFLLFIFNMCNWVKCIYLTYSLNIFYKNVYGLLLILVSLWLQQMKKIIAEGENVILMKDY